MERGWNRITRKQKATTTKADPNRPISQQLFSIKCWRNTHTNAINRGSVLFRHKAFINVISNTCVSLPFYVKLAAVWLWFTENH